MLILCREYELWLVLETPLGVAECGLYHEFPHVFYKLWLVGGDSKRYVEVII